MLPGQDPSPPGHLPRTPAVTTAGKTGSHTAWPTLNSQLQTSKVSPTCSRETLPYLPIRSVTLTGAFSHLLLSSVLAASSPLPFPYYDRSAQKRTPTSPHHETPNMPSGALREPPAPATVGEHPCSCAKPASRLHCLPPPSLKDPAPAGVSSHPWIFPSVLDLSC